MMGQQGMDSHISRLRYKPRAFPLSLLSMSSLYLGIQCNDSATIISRFNKTREFQTQSQHYHKISKSDDKSNHHHTEQQMVAWMDQSGPCCCMFGRQPHYSAHSQWHNSVVCLSRTCPIAGVCHQIDCERCGRCCDRRTSFVDAPWHNSVSRAAWFAHTHAYTHTHKHKHAHARTYTNTTTRITEGAIMQESEADNSSYIWTPRFLLYMSLLPKETNSVYDEEQNLPCKINQPHSRGQRLMTRVRWGCIAVRDSGLVFKPLSKYLAERLLHRVVFRPRLRERQVCFVKRDMWKETYISQISKLDCGKRLPTRIRQGRDAQIIWNRIP